MKLYLSNLIEIIEATPQEKKQIIKDFTFDNPKYADSLSFGRSTRNIAKELCLINEENGFISAPMGLLEYLNVTFEPEISDFRTDVPTVIPFTGKLRPYQEQFINDALTLYEGVLGGLMIAATGSGKTVSGIALASRLKQRTLILVRSKDLAQQWIDAIKQFTGLDAGLIGGGKNAEGKQFTIGLTQTLCKRDLSEFNYGLVIADECHNLPANQAFTVMNGLNCQYRYGLSATPQRRDNMEFMIHGALGDVCAEIKQDQLDGKVLPVKVRPIEIPFYAEVETWNDFLSVLINDEDRNDYIVRAAVKSSKTIGTIILCAQVRHCEALGVMCQEQGAKPLVLHGQLPTKERAERMANAPEAQLIIGTLSLLSEGIDLPQLGALIFGAPVSASIDKESPAATRLIQSIGRCRRPYPNKSKAFVLDIIDQCGFGIAAWNKRLHIYHLQEFEVSV